MSAHSRSAGCLTADKPDEKKKSEGFEVQQSDILNSDTTSYLVLDLMGEGCFGKVAKCVNLTKEKDVALKILKSEQSRVSEREINMLKAVSILNPAKTNVVQFFEKFEHKGHTCLAFEMLDRNLYQLLKDRDWKLLSLNEIRPIAQQLLTAFDALKGIGVVHADLKPDNVMLVNHEKQPFRVKLIDFGVSFTASEQPRGLSIQPLCYRAPEVTLGLPLSQAIDMWGLGCVLAFLYLTNHLFAVRCEYQLMKGIVDILGQPADHLLCAGGYTKLFFKVNKYWDKPKWWLKTPREYQLATGIEPRIWEWSIRSLDELITLYPEIQEAIELEDRRAFVSLLKCLLNTDPEQRIGPEEALMHPFISMVHLEDEINTSLYVDDSYEKMMDVQVDEEELTPDNNVEEEPKDEGSLVIARSSAAGSAAPRSCDGISNMSDGAAAAGAEDTSGSAEEEPAVSHDAASRDPDEETDGSPVEVKKSWLKSIGKFFIRAIYRKK